MYTKMLNLVQKTETNRKQRQSENRDNQKTEANKKQRQTVNRGKQKTEANRKQRQSENSGMNVVFLPWSGYCTVNSGSFHVPDRLRSCTNTDYIRQNGSVQQIYQFLLRSFLQSK